MIKQTIQYICDLCECEINSERPGYGITQTYNSGVIDLTRLDEGELHHLCSVCIGQIKFH